MMSLVPDGNVAPDGMVHVVETGAVPPVTAGGAYETAKGTAGTSLVISAGQVIDGRLTGGGGPPGLVGPPQPAASTSRTRQASV
jgi:hypothetical protein